MNRIAILCVEDEPEVRDAIVRDLAPFAESFRIEAAEDAEDARQVVEDCADDCDVVGLILCDHLLPGTVGADLLVEFRTHPDTTASKKILVTGQAGLEDTVKAVNDADLDHYVAKPWSPDALHQVVRKYLTDYVIEQDIDGLPYIATLDSQRLLEAQKLRGRSE